MNNREYTNEKMYLSLAPGGSILTSERYPPILDENGNKKRDAEGNMVFGQNKEIVPAAFTNAKISLQVKTFREVNIAKAWAAVDRAAKEIQFDGCVWWHMGTGEIEGDGAHYWAKCTGSSFDENSIQSIMHSAAAEIGTPL